jgi:hypothetical protein
MKHLLPVALLVACHSAPQLSSQALPQDPHATTIANLVGTWQGVAEGTPYGNFPLRLAFDRRRDGSVHTHLNGGPGMYLDFVFHLQGGRWLLTEEGAVPGVGVQRHTLAPMTAGDWVDGELRVALAMTGDALVWTTTNHGKPHAVFRLRKAAPNTAGSNTAGSNTAGSNTAGSNTAGSNTAGSNAARRNAAGPK